MSDLYVANTSAVVSLAGQRTWIKKGVTIVRAGHPIMDGRESLFDPVKVHFDTGGVEQMTAAPGEKRDVTVYRCDQCDATAKSPAGLAAHKRSHNGGDG